VNTPAEVGRSPVIGGVATTAAVAAGAQHVAGAHAQHAVVHRGIDRLRRDATEQMSGPGRGEPRPEVRADLPAQHRVSDQHRDATRAQLDRAGVGGPGPVGAAAAVAVDLTLQRGAMPAADAPAQLGPGQVGIGGQAAADLLTVDDR